MASSRFEIKTGKDDQFYFNLIAANNEPILRSEGYKAKASWPGKTPARASYLWGDDYSA